MRFVQVFSANLEKLPAEGALPHGKALGEGGRSPAANRGAEDGGISGLLRVVGGVPIVRVERLHLAAVRKEMELLPKRLCMPDLPVLRSRGMQARLPLLSCLSR